MHLASYRRCDTLSTFHAPHTLFPPLSPFRDVNFIPFTYTQGQQCVIFFPSFIHSFLWNYPSSFSGMLFSITTKYPCNRTLYFSFLLSHAFMIFLYSFLIILLLIHKQTQSRVNVFGVNRYDILHFNNVTPYFLLSSLILSLPCI